MNYELYPHQIQGVRHIEKCGGNLLIADEMGLGKTAQVVTALKRNPEWGPAVIVCPASLKYNWQREAQIWGGMHFDIADGQTPPRLSRHDLTHSHKHIIVNYDIVRFWVDYLQQIGVRTVVPDECQALMNPKAKMTKGVYALAQSAERVMGMSGTPLMNNPKELFSILNMIWPDEFPAFFPYADRYCQPRLMRWGWTYNGAENLDELHARLLALGMLRRKKKDYIHDLPDKIRTVLPIELKRKDMDIYVGAREHYLDFIAEHMTHRLKKAKKAESLTKVGVLLQLCAKLKMRESIRWINEHLNTHDGKMVVFGIHQNCIKVLQKHIKAKHVTIDGSTSKHDRQIIVDIFQRDPNVRVFIGNLQAAGSGLTLTAAQTAVFVQMFWRPADHLQAEDRIHRIGQLNQTMIYYLVAANTIEERVCRVLQTKTDIVSHVLDGKAQGESLDIHDMYLKELMKELSL